VSEHARTSGHPARGNLERGEAWQRRSALVAKLRERGVLKHGPVERAMLAVPRHRFIPEVTVKAAYQDEVVVTKRNSEGDPISSASQPAIVAEMLEQLDVRPGQRVLEIGSGTGQHAAYFAPELPHLAWQASDVAENLPGTSFVQVVDALEAQGLKEAMRRGIRDVVPVDEVEAELPSAIRRAHAFARSHAGRQGNNGENRGKVVINAARVELEIVAEERPFWQAREIYMNMSPFTYADQMRQERGELAVAMSVRLVRQVRVPLEHTG
jgi:SAM-dependent methyltransferase